MDLANTSRAAEDNARWKEYYMWCPSDIAWLLDSVDLTSLTLSVVLAD